VTALNDYETARQETAAIVAELHQMGEDFDPRAPDLIARVFRPGPAFGRTRSLVGCKRRRATRTALASKPRTSQITLNEKGER